MSISRNLQRIIICFVAAAALLIGLQAGHKSLAVFIPDPGGGGGGGYGIFDSSSPPSNSARFTTNTNCTSVLGTSNPCNPVGGSLQTPYYVVGNNAQDYTYAYMTVAVYVKKLPNSTVTIQVKNASPQCHSASNAGLTGPDYDLGGAPPTQYVLYNGSGVVAAQAIFGGDCNSVITFTVPSSSAIAMNTPSNNLDGYFNLVADVLPSSNEGENSFRIQTDLVNGAGYIGGQGVAGIGFRDIDLNNGNYWNSFTPFAAPVDCNDYNNGSTFNGSVSFQDTDIAHLDWNTKMVIEMQVQKVNPDGTLGAWSLVPGTRKVQGVNMPQNGPLYSGAFQRDSRYRVLLANMGVRNTIRVNFSSGLDGVFADIFERPTLATCTNTNDLASCSISFSPSINIPPNSPVAVTIVASNKGTSTWDSKYYMKRVGPQVVNLQNVTGTVIPGKTFTFTDTVQSPGSGGSKKLTYRMYNSTGPFDNSCTKTIVVPPTSSPDPQISATCSTVTVYNINNANIPATYHPGGGPAMPITQVPIAIIVTDKSNNLSTTFLVNGGAPKGAGSFDIPTAVFNMGGGAVGQMWPHKVYTLQLAVEGFKGFPPLDSATYTNNGNWNPSQDANQAGYYYGIDTFNTVNVGGPGDCFDASCVGGQPVDAEPGQTKTFTYGANITNNTGVPFSMNNPGGGYGFSVSATGGINSGTISGINVNPDKPAPASDPGTHIDVNFSARLDFTGTFTITMLFQGNPISLPNLQTPCPSSPPSTPHTLPYFQVTNGDISTGGGFYYVDPVDNKTKCGGNNPVSPYISPATSSTNDGNAGGIRAFGSQSTGKGSLTDLGVYSLGYLRGSTGGPIGFFSGRGNTFADVGLPPSPDNVGGYLNSNSTSHCIDNLYQTTRGNTQLDFSTIAGNINNAGNAQYQASGNVTISGGSIPAGRQFTLYVDGNVKIDGNINYAKTWDPNTQSSIPFFALIVKGNIILTHNVTNIDGLYVAQPTDPDNTGRFDTCDNDNGDFCPQVLTVNGAVIAQRVELYRVHGTLANPSLSADVNGICSNGPTNSPPAYCSAAEIFNYVPSMILGAPQFAPLDSGAVVPSSLQGIFNLPPVF